MASSLPLSQKHPSMDKLQVRHRRHTCSQNLHWLRTHHSPFSIYQLIEKGTTLFTPLWETLLHDFQQWLKAAGRTPRTIQTRTNWIKTLAQTTSSDDPCKVSTAEITDWLANPDWKPNSRRNALASAPGSFTTSRLVAIVPMIRPSTFYRSESPEQCQFTYRQKFSIKR